MKNYLEELKKWFDEKIKIHQESHGEKSIFKQGEIYYVDFGYNIGSEFNGKRPAIIFELSKYSFWRTNAIVIPITSYKTGKKYNIFDIYLAKDRENNLESDSIIKLFHIRDISKKRIKNKIGKINAKQLEEVQEKFTKIFIKNPKS